MYGFSFLSTGSGHTFRLQPAMRTGRKPVRNRNRTTPFQLADTGTTTELRTIGLADISGRFSGKTTGRQWKYLGQRKNAFFRLDPCSFQRKRIESRTDLLLESKELG